MNVRTAPRPGRPPSAGTRGRPRLLRATALVMLAVTMVTVLAPTAGARVAAAGVGTARLGAARLGTARLGTDSGWTASSHAWAWPLAPPWRVLRSFEAPPTRYSAGHRGIDLAAESGRTVLAPVAATVYFTGQVAGRPVLTLQPADGVLVSVEPVLSTLAAGDRVPRGGIVGTVATGGHCGNVCLHLGVRVNGQYVSPLIYFGGVQRAVLLPIRG